MVCRPSEKLRPPFCRHTNAHSCTPARLFHRCSVAGRTRRASPHCEVTSRRCVGSSGALMARSSRRAAMTTSSASGQRGSSSSTGWPHTKPPSRRLPGARGSQTCWPVAVVRPTAASASGTRPLGLSSTASTLAVRCALWRGAAMSASCCLPMDTPRISSACGATPA